MTRTMNACIAPEPAVTPQKQRRMIEASLVDIRGQQFRHAPCRFGCRECYRRAGSGTLSRTRLKWPGSICDGGIMLDLLKKIHLFENLSITELEKIQKIARKEAYAKDTAMFFEGDPGNRCYAIIKGEVRISKFIPNIGEEALAVLKMGGLFR
ncbi:MAG TPA: hypothetical protein VL122_04360 [Nitrospirota bacterium]|nr:hypothetical protein [Nitrospirota bacterium]